MCNIFLKLFLLISLISNSNYLVSFERDCNKYITVDRLANLNDFIVLSNGNFIVIFKSNDYLYIKQYDNCGSLNKDYGTDGVIEIKLNKFNSINSIVLKNDGTVFLAGSSNGSFLISKYGNNGNLDTSFGDKTYLARSGSVVTNIGNNSYISNIVLNNNRIISAGISDNSIALAGYLSDGTLDKSFGNNGYELVSLGINNFVNNIMLDKNNRIVISATIDSKAVIIRFTPNGKFDIVFSTNC